MSGGVGRTSRRHAFVLSTGRTGTQFLATHFAQKPNTVAVHEPRPSWRLRLLSGARLEGMATDEELAGHLRALRQSVLNDASSDIYVESNPFLYGFAAAIPEVFGNAVVVHIVRDPRHYVRSAIDHGNAHGIKHAFNHHVPFWTARADRSDETANVTPLERLAIYWRDINTLISSTADPQHYLVVRFEDLFGSLGPINEIEQALGAKLTTEMAALGTRMNQSPTRKQDWEDWELEEVRTLDRICGPMMSDFGYGTEAAWTDMVS